MRIYLKAFVLNLAKNNEDVKKSSFIPSRLRQIEREMEAGKVTVSEVMIKLKDEEKFRKAFSEGDWKMIEKEVNKMIK